MSDEEEEIDLKIKFGEEIRLFCDIPKDISNEELLSQIVMDFCVPKLKLGEGRELNLARRKFTLMKYLKRAGSSDTIRGVLQLDHHSHSAKNDENNIKIEEQAKEIEILKKNVENLEGEKAELEKRVSVLKTKHLELEKASNLEEKNEVVESEPKHPYKCDKCGMNPIVGTRYSCLTKVDYDVCENCYGDRRNNGLAYEGWVVFKKPGEIGYAIPRKKKPMRFTSIPKAKEEKRGVKQSSRSRFTRMAQTTHVSHAPSPSVYNPYPTASIHIGPQVQEQSNPMARSMFPTRSSPVAKSPKAPKSRVAIPKKKKAKEESKRNEPLSGLFSGLSPEIAADYKNKIELMKDMGFYDKEKTLRMLIKHKGDLQGVVREYLSV